MHQLLGGSQHFHFAFPRLLGGGTLGFCPLAELPHPGALLPVEDIRLGGSGVTVLNQDFFHRVLHFFNGQEVIVMRAGQKEDDLIRQEVRGSPVAPPEMPANADKANTAQTVGTVATIAAMAF